MRTGVRIRNTSWAGCRCNWAAPRFAHRRHLPQPPSESPPPPTTPPQPGGPKRPQARRATKADANAGDAFAAQNLSAAAAGAASGENLPPTPPQPALPRKKKRWFGLKSLLLMMLLCMSIAALAIYLTVPNKSSVTGQLRFANF